MAEVPLEIGGTVALPKPGLDAVLARLRLLGYRTVGPRVEDGAVTYGAVETLEDLPRGYASEQTSGHYRLSFAGHSRYFDVTPGPHTWKQYLFPSMTPLLTIRRSGKGWRREPPVRGGPRYALVGVRACELAAIEIQDRVFLREGHSDPLYRERRQDVFILAANCLHPAGTCFCVSMGTGPRARGGFDLGLTELEDMFLIEIGSELGRTLLAEVPCRSASAFLLQAARQGLERAEKRMGRKLDTEGLPEVIIGRLDHPRWAEAGRRCLSCASCTQVCPTCFCWDVRDRTDLDGRTSRRERVWDSCFNPSYSYQAGGNTRPTVRSRYRQWLSHKLGTWKEQFDTLGCVGCGRCITWCPVGIDITEEAAAIRQEARS